MLPSQSPPYVARMVCGSRALQAILCLTLLFRVAPALGDDAVPGPAVSAVADVAAEEPGGPVHAIPTTLDRVGRILVPVHVNGAGPFRFILDTGANRSAVSPRLVSELSLVPTGSTVLSVNGVTGAAALPAVDVESLQTESLTLARNTRVPVLHPTVLADADGILGIEGLDKTVIDIDFKRDTVAISRSAPRMDRSELFRVPVSLRHRGLLLADARVGSVRAKAIIDTGAQQSLGNPALQEALAGRRGGNRKLAVTTVYGATPALSSGESIVAPTIVIGNIKVYDLEVTFADLHVFKVWDLDSRPALLIGMDLLGTAERILVDYRRREILVKPGKATRKRR